MLLFECPGTNIFQLTMNLQLKAWVSTALENLDVIV